MINKTQAPVVPSKLQEACCPSGSIRKPQFHIESSEITDSLGIAEWSACLARNLIFMITISRCTCQCNRSGRQAAVHYAVCYQRHHKIYQWMEDLKLTEICVFKFHSGNLIDEGKILLFRHKDRERETNKIKQWSSGKISGSKVII